MSKHIKTQLQIIKNDFPSAPTETNITTETSSSGDTFFNDWEDETAVIGTKNNKTKLVIKNGSLDEIVNFLEINLADTRMYFSSGGRIVRIHRDKSRGDTFIADVSKAELFRALDRRILFKKLSRNSDSPITEVTIDPPNKHIVMLYETGLYPHLPNLVGIARQPFFRPDMSLQDRSGYDETTGLYADFDETEYDIPENLTREDALSALANIQNLLSEFVFATPADKSAAIAAIITAAIRTSLKTAPMIHVTGHQVGTGKSYLCSIIASFASHASPSALTFPSTDDECQKLLLASLLTSPASVIFDNLTSDIIPYKSLCSAITEEYLTGRVLGTSKTAIVSTKSLILSSGNNVGPIKDMSRRCLTIKLDPKVEIPAARSFDGSPLERVQADRAFYVSQMLIIVSAWINSGCQPLTCKSLASFGDWTQLVRQPLLWLGLSDPAEGIFKQLEVDPDRETLLQVHDAWMTVFSNSFASVKEALDKADSFMPGAGELKEAIAEVAYERGVVNRKKLGRWLSRHEGQIVNGRRLERGPIASGSVKWRVTYTLGVSGVSGVSESSHTVVDIDDNDESLPF